MAVYTFLEAYDFQGKKIYPFCTHEGSGLSATEKDIRKTLPERWWKKALNDGKTSAILSFCRTIIFMVLPVLILPKLFGMDGVWFSITAGEILSIVMSIYYFTKYRGRWRITT